MKAKGTGKKAEKGKKKEECKDDWEMRPMGKMLDTPEDYFMDKEKKLD